MNLKFRVWDEDERRMYYPGECPDVDPNNCGKLVYCDMETVAIGMDSQLYLIDECGNYEYPENFKKRFKVMLFTGLKDEHGMDIYEEDIVKLGNYPFTGDNSRVRYEDGILLPFGHVDCPVSEEDDLGKISPSARYCNVIGNTFEQKHIKLGCY